MPTDQLSILCDCGKKLKAPSTAVGRRAKCPACGNVLTITLPPPPAPPPSEPVEDDPLGALYDLADAEKSAAKSNQLDDSPRCPKCATSMPAGAVLCTNCGHDLRGKKNAAAITKPQVNLDYAKASSTKKKRDKMAPEGSFLVGLGLSAAFAAGGGVVWFIITWFTDFDIFFFSILIGLLAGLGMQVGQKGFSSAGGWTAGGITLATFLLARVALVAVILAPKLRHTIIASNPADKYDHVAVEVMVDQEYKAEGLDSDDSTEEQDDHVNQVAVDKLAAMTPGEYKTFVDKAHEQQKFDELVGMEEMDIIRTRSVGAAKTSANQFQEMRDEAKNKITAMTSAERDDEMKRLTNAQSQRIAAIRAARASNPSTPRSSPSISTAGKVVGATFIMLLIFGIRSIICLIVSIGLAYRTAAGSVSAW